MLVAEGLGDGPEWLWGEGELRLVGAVVVESLGDVEEGGGLAGVAIVAAAVAVGGVAGGSLRVDKGLAGVWSELIMKSGEAKG